MTNGFCPNEPIRKYFFAAGQSFSWNKIKISWPLKAQTPPFSWFAAWQAMLVLSHIARWNCNKQILTDRCSRGMQPASSSNISKMETHPNGLAFFYFCLLSLHCCIRDHSATALPPTVRFGKDEVMILRTENHLGQAISRRPQAWIKVGESSSWSSKKLSWTFGRCWLKLSRGIYMCQMQRVAE